MRAGTVTLASYCVTASDKVGAEGLCAIATGGSSKTWGEGERAAATCCDPTPRLGATLTYVGPTTRSTHMHPSRRKCHSWRADPYASLAMYN